MSKELYCIYDPISLSPIHRIHMMHNVWQNHLFSMTYEKAYRSIMRVLFIYLSQENSIFSTKYFVIMTYPLSHWTVLILFWYVIQRSQFNTEPRRTANKSLTFHHIISIICNTQNDRMLEYVLEITSFNSQTCMTTEEQIIQHCLKSLSRNYWYCTATWTTVKWLASCQSYRWVYGCIASLKSRTQFRLLCGRREKHSVKCIYFVRD
jgi:hypothetical protein